MIHENPFIVVGYESPEYFCDRQDETETLLSAVSNQRHITLASLRRMGKTGLIGHTFHQLRQDSGYFPVYLDILPTSDLYDFIKQLSKAIFLTQKSKQTLDDQLLQLLAPLRPKISFDSLTGQSIVEFGIKNEQEAEKVLDGLFAYLNKQSTTVVVAIDEFQQINQYPEEYAESLLRSLIQKYRYIAFIFSGSQGQILDAIFQDQSRPFYQSTQLLSLKPIKADQYNRFILEKFYSGGQELTEDFADHILTWTRCHTYYVQYFCNRLYSMKLAKIHLEHIQQIAALILSENEMVYHNYRNLLTKQQFSLLKAIAKEECVVQPTSKEFLFKHQLGAASSVKTILDALLKKEIVIQNDIGYMILDVFFSRWLQML